MKKYLPILIFLFTTNFSFAASVTVNNHATLVAAVGGTADTIFINGTIVTSAEINILRNIVFIGINNATLNGNNSHRIFKLGDWNIITNITVIIENIKFINGNTNIILDTNGSAIFANCDTLTIKNSLFQNNKNSAILVENRHKWLEIENTTFDSNTSDVGGAICAGYHTPIITLRKCVFSNNTANHSGGAIYAMNGGVQMHFRIIDCSFYNNSATYSAGAISAVATILTIINSEFYNNSNTNVFGNIHLELSHCNIINSTITKNRGINAGGISTERSGSIINIYNSIITGNTNNWNGTIQNNDINIFPSALGNTLNMYNSVYQSINGTINTNVNNFSGIAPTDIFKDFAANDFRLLCGSVAVNGGNDNYYVNQWNTAFPLNTITTPAVHTDIKGDIRLLSTQIDMGAYEGASMQMDLIDYFCENRTYNFRGRVLTNEGIYYDTIPNEDCDTIIKLNLTELYNQHYNYRDTSYKCEWYYFGGDSINETGIYVDTLIARNGCDSIVTVDLLVRPREFDDTLNICVERLPYTIYDTIFSTTAVSGTYIIHHRCATITLLLNVTPKVETFPPNIPIICADDSNFILEFQNTNEINTKPPTHYDIIFDNKAITAGFENQSNDFGNDNKIILHLPEKIYPDYYNCKIILKDNVYDCTPQVFDIEFIVLYPKTIMEQKWDDVIALLNEQSCGYKFTGYQWYQNGEKMVGENRAYIYRPLVVGDEYSVLITREDGSQMFSCPLQAIVKDCCNEIPTVVQPNGVIKLPDENAMVRLITVTGIPLSNYQPSTKEIIAPTQQGVYLLEILNNNSRMVVKIVVR